MSGRVVINPYIGGEIRIDAEDILEFVADYIKKERISKIENMDWKEVIK
jgi:hypothetical protein